MNWIGAWLVRLLPRANTTKIDKAIKDLHKLLPRKGTEIMSDPTPTDLVSISQAVLTGYGTTLETFVGVMKPYIASLIAGEQPQLSPGDVSALTQALSDAEALEPVTPPTPSP